MHHHAGDVAETCRGTQALESYDGAILAEETLQLPVHRGGIDRNLRPAIV